MNKLNNKELLELIKKNVIYFNRYREKYPNQEINFSNANLEGVYLDGADLYKADLYDANLERVNLEDVKIILTKDNLKSIRGCNL